MTSAMRLRLAYLAAFLVGLSFWGRPPFDPDLGWHLLGGALSHDCILSLLGNSNYSCDPLLRGDPINAFRTHWHNYHWLGQLVLYFLFQWGGILAIQTALGLCGGVIGLLILHLARLHSNASIESLLLLTALHLTLLYDVSSARPQMITILAVLLALIVVAKDRGAKLELICLSVITIISVNIHVYWMFVPIVWVACRWGSQGRTTKGVLVGAAWLSFLGFVSPYGIFGSLLSQPNPFLNFFLIVDYLQMPVELRSKIVEMQSPLRQIGVVALILLTTLIVTARYTTVTRVRERPGIFAIFGVSFALSIRAVKFIGLYSILSVPFLARLLEDLESGSALQGSKWRVVGQRSVLMGTLLLGVWWSVKRLPDEVALNQKLHDYLPLEACAEVTKLRSQWPANRKFRLATDFDTGGWCRWAAYQADPKFALRVTTDGRTQQVPVQHYLDTFDLYALKEGWPEVLAKWHPDAVLAPRTAPLAHELFRLSAEWVPLYRNEDFAVFIYRGDKKSESPAAVSSPNAPQLSE